MNPVEQINRIQHGSLWPSLVAAEVGVKLTGNEKWLLNFLQQFEREERMDAAMASAFPAVACLHLYRRRPLCRPLSGHAHRWRNSPARQLERLMRGEPAIVG
jgi:hypothetical protein